MICYFLVPEFIAKKVPVFSIVKVLVLCLLNFLFYFISTSIDIIV